ncbi:hypothetical protein [Hymenobacter sp. 5414T-23]|uniref:hypothetical protein n=1 Tax=Hymenobacter sp. 5414T-23 TaxID=2932252 RepID=UPI001FD54BE6|nr:hypothetical protein [Hymenobacter sp. 5414T-23]UOQ81010.1 hypothetical protein MUN83_19720 [Hymenobacter sp. 5414T-23]
MTKQPATASAASATLAALAATPSRAYLTTAVDEATGEVTETSRFRYLPGHPRQVRFDAKAGQFNINGTTPLGNSLSFIPLAWRIFQDDILNMGRKLWAELFYADDKGAICAVLFHGYSVENLYRLIEPLFYDDLTLADVVVKVQASKKETIKDNKKATYYIAEFSYEPADPQQVQARREFAQDFPIWREETSTGTADIRTSYGYRNRQEGAPQLEAAPAAEAAPVTA